MDICLLCTNVINNNSVSIYDTNDSVKLKDILFDLNYKLPLQGYVGDKICFECCVNLIKLYNFRENCCGLFGAEENNCNYCKICFESANIGLCLNTLSVGEKSLHISDILMELCTYNIKIECNDKVCAKCYENLFKNYSFHILCQKAVKFWTSRIIHNISRCTLKKKNKTEIKKRNSRKPFKCTVCSYEFSSHFHLRKHSKNHNKEKPFLCEVCSKTFSINFNLKKHLRSHTGEKPFKCKLCSKSFAHKHGLKEHLLIHTGERPYMCEICSKSFNRYDTLKSHLKLHDYQEKLFKCQVCSKSFVRSGSLKVHLRTHTGEKPYICEICSKSFTQNVSLRKHFKIHTGEKPFQCEICFKCFSRKDKLKEHTRIHTGEKPYKCEFCPESFTFGIYLKKHLQTHM